MREKEGKDNIEEQSLAKGDRAGKTKKSRKKQAAGAVGGKGMEQLAGTEAGDLEKFGATASEMPEELVGEASLLEFENDLWDKEIAYIAGIDEVGRGCLFGDVVAAAVILPRGLIIPGIDDSKKLSAKKRELLYEDIMRQAVAVSIGKVDCRTIDRINIKQAARLAMRKALEQLQPQPDYLLVDAEKVETDIPQLAVIHGDARSQSIAAASIIAKVTRDRMCLQWDMEYPEYGIALHKGYATKTHREAILEFGACPLHRTSFLGNLLSVQAELF